MGRVKLFFGLSLAILTTLAMQAQWNGDNEETVWNFEDCWPIYLLDDARDLINILKLGFGLRLDIKELEG